jgi:asparagine synthase (glutamine-hydrolysing)
MSGVFGIVDTRRRSSVASTVAAMAECMSHRPWYRADRYVDDAASVALGRIGIGVFNRAAQPYCSPDGDLVVFLAGVLFDRVGDAVSDTERIAELYREHGPMFASRLRGEFVVLVWDRPRAELVLTNDRMGFYPTYYACRDGGLLFAPEVKAIIGPGEYPVRLDRTALAEYMRFQHLLGERTFVEGIHLLPYASVLRFGLQGGQLEIASYWRLHDIVAQPPLRFDDAVQETGRLLDRAVNRVPAIGHRTALYLTGGLDSRLLLGLIEPRDQPITTLTFGQRDSRDIVYARRLARRAGSRHHEFGLDDGTWVADNVDLHVALTEGFHGWIHAHGISTLPAARELAEVALTGCGGGTVVGGWLNRLPSLQAPTDDRGVLTAQQFHRFSQLYSWPGLNEAEEEVLYADDLRPEMRGRAFDSLEHEVARYMECRAEVRGEFLHVRNHDFRMIHNTVVMLRSHLEACSPYFDYDLFEFVYGLPVAVRGYKRLSRAVLQQRAPHLCYVPHARNDFLPTTHAWLHQPHAWLTRLAHKINAHLAPIFPQYSPLYADYERYVRTDLHDWAEDLLVGERTCSRGLFNPIFLRSLWDRLMGGREPDIIGKAAPIMTYELMLRRFYD